jgi:nucleotide-binding universal stress UspA family protein
MIRNILVPTDFSSGSDAALACARELASAVGASLHLMHVVENPFAPGGFMEMYPLPPGYVPSELEAAAAQRLEGCLTPDDKSARHATITTSMGVPAREILQRLDQEPPIDLVVMATHGRGGVARMVMGSVADKVVRGARCPVLTLKECDGYGRGAQ